MISENLNEMTNTKELEEQLRLQRKQEKKLHKQEGRELTAQRHSEGKYYFYEFNRDHYSKLKITEVNFFFYATLLFAINCFFTIGFGLSSVDQVWKNLMYVIPSLMIGVALFNRFFESITSNSKNRNVSLIFQRLLGIIYILVLFLYAIIVIILIKEGYDPNSTVPMVNEIAQIDSHGWLLFNILIAWFFVISKMVIVSLYGINRQDRVWESDQMRKDLRDSKSKEYSEENIHADFISKNFDVSEREQKDEFSSDLKFEKETIETQNEETSSNKSTDDYF